MIYVTGDTHADFSRFNTRIFPEQEEMSKTDYVIILKPLFHHTDNSE